MCFKMSLKRNDRVSEAVSRSTAAVHSPRNHADRNVLSCSVAVLIVIYWWSPRPTNLAVCCRNAFRNVSGWKSSLRSRVSSRRRPPSDLSTHVWMAMVLVTRPRRNNIGSSGPSHIWSQQIGVCGRGKVKVKGMFLYSVVSSPLDRSKRFTLFALPGRPVHPDTNSTSLGSILATQQFRMKTIHSYFHDRI